jgi:glutamine amidotransferase
MDVAVIDYGMGNLHSVAKALESQGARVRLVTVPAELGAAEALVLPGVGALEDCVGALRATGLDAVVKSWIHEDRPFLGVCLGLQALFEWSEEGGVTGLGILPGKVVRFRRPAGTKIPHMGWNAVDFRAGDALAAGLEAPARPFYFVHSFHAEPADPAHVLGVTDYVGSFTSAVGRGRLRAVQFHPEKSQAAGLRLYRNFLDFAASARH